MSKRSGVLVIVIAALAYLVAVTQRSTMGIAGLVATERFHTNAEQLSALAVFQLVVYAAMQVPVGLLLDRYGPRLLLSLGAGLMACGQLAVGLSSTLTYAVMGRMLVGLGDAFTFISMIRLINGWYHGKRASQLQQWLGNLGQLGQVLSAIPFAALLHAEGWATAFISMSAVGVFVAMICFLVIKDDREPLHRKAGEHTFKKAIAELRLSIREPSTRMAFWTHFSTQSSGTAILLLWGVPYLSGAQHLEHATVALLLSGFVFFGILSGFIYAQVCAHYPNLRKLVVVIVAAGILFVFALLIIWPGATPFWLLVLWVVVVGSGGPASMIAFDYSKQYVAKNRLGATNGFINIGGFLATFVMMFLIGVTLDLVHNFALTTNKSGALYTVAGFQVAFVAVLVVIGFGLWRYLVNESAVKALSSRD